MSSKLVARVVLVLLAVPSALIAVWILAAPRSFYDDFPGLGAIWVAPDGPFNEHLLRDYGAATLGLVVLTLCALVWLTRPLVLATGLAWLAASIPHVVYHLRNLEPYPADEHVALVGSLAVTPILAIVLLLTARGVERESAAAPASTDAVGAGAR
jgi:hypothetical protein